MTPSYFRRVGQSSFLATSHVSGAWNTDYQHIAPALGLLVHVVECNRDARRDDGFAVARLSYDILGTVPVGQVDTTVRVVRPGKTIELVEATLAHDGRDIVLLRAWLMRAHDAAGYAATSHPRIAPPEEMAQWDPSTVWPGGFIASADVRRTQYEPGRASYWVRTPVALLEDEEVSAYARAASLFDIANGMTVRVDPEEAAFPNIDLTAHLFAEPRGDWLGFDTTVSFGPTGFGLTSSVVHDTEGPIGTVAQCLTLRPTHAPSSDDTTGA